MERKYAGLLVRVPDRDVVISYNVIGYNTFTSLFHLEPVSEGYKILWLNKEALDELIERYS